MQPLDVLRLASYMIALAVSAAIGGYSLYGYTRVRDAMLAQEAAAFILIAAGAAVGAFSFVGYYFDAVGFLIVGILHAKTAQRMPMALLLVPEVFGAGIAIVFSLYAGVETIIFYAKKRRVGALFSGLAFFIIAASMFAQTVPLVPLPAAYVAQAVGYMLLVPALVI